MAFSIIAKLGLDKSGFDSALNGALGSLKSRLAGAFGLAAIAAFTAKVVNAADSIGDMAEQTAISTDEVQRLTAVMGRAGLEFASVQKFIFALQKLREESIAGKPEAQKLFASMGISPEKIAGMKDLEVLYKSIFAQIAKFNPDKVKELMEAIGGSKIGPKMQGAIGQLAGGGSDFLQFSQEEIKNLSKLKDGVESLGRQFLVFSLKYAEAGATVVRHLPYFLILEKLFSKAKGAPKWFTSESSGIAPAAVVIPEKRDQKVLDEIFQMRLKRLSVDDQIFVMQEQINKAIADENALRKAGKENLADKTELERLRMEAELDALKKQGQTPPEQARFEAINPQLNALQQIGAQVSESNTIQIVLKESLNVAKRTAVAAEDLNRKTVPQEPG